MRTHIARTRSRRHKRSLDDLDITSLLDILVIILVFLLQHYSTAGHIEAPPKGIQLPASQEKTYSSPGIKLVVSAENLRLEKGDKINFSEFTDGELITPLSDQLLQLKKGQKKTQELLGKTGPLLPVNLLVDKSVPYKILKKVMHTCAQAEFTQFKMIVLGEQG